MAITNFIHSVVVSASTANFTAHTYSEVYAGTTASPTINGVIVPMVAGTTIKMTVRSITGDTGGIYLFGDKINLSNDSQIIGGSFTQA